VELEGAGNICPSIPVGYAAHMKETYENMEMLLKHIQYSKYDWNICGDLKVVALLLGMQLRYTKYCCFMCEWDSRAKELHYVKQKWPLRKNSVPRQKTWHINHLSSHQRYFCLLFI